MVIFLIYIVVLLKITIEVTKVCSPWGLKMFHYSDGRVIKSYAHPISITQFEAIVSRKVEWK